MDIDRIEWLRQSRRVGSHRRMYSLAVLIASDTSSTPAEWRCAQIAKRLLSRVVGLALAEATDLERGRVAFSQLVEIVAVVACQPEQAKVACHGYVDTFLMERQNAKIGVEMFQRVEEDG
jgi:hypothetical protein